MYKQEVIKPYSKEGDKREQIETMFNKIAHSYDTLNHTLSLGIDKIWRKKAIDFLRKNRNSTDSVLDIATGTGDFAILAYKKLKPSIIIGCDISEGMMSIGRQKVEKMGLSDKITFQNEDCSHLSFNDNSFDAVISAFALRNFQDLDQCLSEMHRVLAIGGNISIIDLCSPTTFPMKYLFYIYKKVVMPILGKLISKDNKAYTYLPDSMDAVPQAEEMRQIIEKAGFKHTKFKRLLLGVCILYTGEK